MKRRNGFTLVELLTIIVIISLLVAILMPSLSRSLALARKASCAVNLKSIGTGLITRQADRAINQGTMSEIYPEAEGIGNAPLADPPVDRNWQATLIREADVEATHFLCPAVKSFAKPTLDADKKYLMPRKPYYGMNAKGKFDTTPTGGTRTYVLNDNIKIVAMDFEETVSSAGAITATGWGADPGDAGDSQKAKDLRDKLVSVARDRHAKTMNVLYNTGAVRSATPDPDGTKEDDINPAYQDTKTSSYIYYKNLWNPDPND